MPKKIRTLPLRPTHGPILRATKPKLPPVDDGSAWSPLDLWLFLHELGKLADDEGDPVFGPMLTEHRDGLFRMLSPVDQAGAMERMRPHEFARALVVVREQKARLEAH